MFKKEDVVKYVKEHDDQRKKLIELVLKRNNGNFDKELYKAYEESGMFYIRHYEDFKEIVEELGGSIDDYPKSMLISEGYMIGSYGYIREIIFFINYSYTRESHLKYLMVYPESTKEEYSQVKLYGMEDSKQALEEGTLYVTEGVLDRLRLKTQNVPVVAILGTKVTKYFLHFSKRFNQLVYIGDNDEPGVVAYRDMRKKGLVIGRKKVPKGKDVDDFGRDYPSEFENWVKKNY